MWFDVGVKRYTTNEGSERSEVELWFDVGVKRYTTREQELGIPNQLWFDVGVKRYTTLPILSTTGGSCGLM